MKKATNMAVNKFDDSMIVHKVRQIGIIFIIFISKASKLRLNLNAIKRTF
jgi:hypothetical protein